MWKSARNDTCASEKPKLTRTFQRDKIIIMYMNAILFLRKYKFNKTRTHTRIHTSVLSVQYVLVVENKYTLIALNEGHSLTFIKHNYTNCIM